MSKLWVDVCGSLATYPDELSARSAARALLDATAWSSGFLIATHCVTGGHWHLCISSRATPRKHTYSAIVQPDGAWADNPPPVARVGREQG